MVLAIILTVLLLGAGVFFLVLLLGIAFAIFKIVTNPFILYTIAIIFIIFLAIRLKVFDKVARLF